MAGLQRQLDEAIVSHTSRERVLTEKLAEQRKEHEAELARTLDSLRRSNQSWGICRGLVSAMGLYLSWACICHGLVFAVGLYLLWPLSVCACMLACLCVCLRACVCVRASMRTKSMCLYPCIHVRVYVWVCAPCEHLFACILQSMCAYACMCVHVCARARVHVQACKCVCVCVRACL